jgi:hypothetical protein
MIMSGEVKSAGGDSEVGASSPTSLLENDIRDEHMAAIRQILADVMKDVDNEPKAEVEERPAPAVPRAPMRHRDDAAQSGDKPISWVDRTIKAGKAAKGQSVPSGCDVARLRRSHDKRIKKLLRSKARRKQTGAFLTGLILVTAVAATMTGLYVQRSQIISTSPEMAPAINEYVVTFDRYSVEVNERTAEWSGWLAERVGNLTGKEE